MFLPRAAPVPVGDVGGKDVFVEELVGSGVELSCTAKKVYEGLKRGCKA